MTCPVQKVPSPLADFPLVHTQDVRVAEEFLSRNLEDSLRIMRATNLSDFKFEMNGVPLGQTSVIFNKFHTPVSIEAD